MSRGRVTSVLAVGDGLVDVGAAAELGAEQHLDRVGELLGQVHHGGVEDAPATSAAPGSRPAPRRTPTRTRPRTPSSRTGRWPARCRAATTCCAAPVADQPLRDDGAVLGLVVLAGSRRWSGSSRCRAAAGRRVRAARLSAPVTAARVRLRDPPLDLRDHPARPPARAVALVVSGMTRFRLSRVPTRCTSGSTAAEHLRLEQQLAQVQPVDRVALHDLHDRGREVGPDVAEPARDASARTRRARPTAVRPPAGRSGVAVVERGQRRVDRLVAAGQARARRGPPAEPQPSSSRQRRQPLGAASGAVAPARVRVCARSAAGRCQDQGDRARARPRRGAASSRPVAGRRARPRAAPWPPSRRTAARPIWPAPARRNSPNVRRSSGSTSRNSSSARPPPSVEHAEQVAVVDQQQAAAGQEPLDPGGLVRRRRRRPTARRRSRAAASVQVSTAGVGQQPGRPGRRPGRAGRRRPRASAASQRCRGQPVTALRRRQGRSSPASRRRTPRACRPSPSAAARRRRPRARPRRPGRPAQIRTGQRVDRPPPAPPCRCRARRRTGPRAPAAAAPSIRCATSASSGGRASQRAQHRGERVGQVGQQRTLHRGGHGRQVGRRSPPCR